MWKSPDALRQNAQRISIEYSKKHIGNVRLSSTCGWLDLWSCVTINSLLTLSIINPRRVNIHFFHKTNPPCNLQIIITSTIASHGRPIWIMNRATIFNSRISRAQHCPLFIPCINARLIRQFRANGAR